METYGCIILPINLLTNFATQTDHTQCWLNGFPLQDENILLCLQLQFNDAPPVNMPETYYDRILTHRAAQLKGSDFTARAALLAKVPAGFGERISGTQELPIQDFATITGLSPEQITAARLAVFVEIQESKPRVTGLLLVPKEQLLIFGRLDVVSIGSRSKPGLEALAINYEGLKSKRVLIVGVGSGGAEIALNLASVGVGQLHLVDFDRVHTNNYLRSLFDRRDLGREKARVVAEIIKEHELPSQVVPVNMSVLASAEGFLDLLATKPDLVVVATDTVASRRFINYSCYKLGIPTVIAGTLRGGTISEVFVVGGGFTACYECLRAALGAALEPAQEQRTDPYLGGEEKSLGSSAVRSDVAIAASLATRVALSLLDPEHFAPMNHAYTVFCREPTPELRAPFSCIGPVGLHFVDISSDRECPLCGSAACVVPSVETRSESDRIIAEADLDAGESDNTSRGS